MFSGGAVMAAAHTYIHEQESRVAELTQKLSETLINEQ